MDNNSQPAGTTARFFRRLDWAAFWTATLAAFAVYAYTLAPTVTLEDSGELAVAADSLGVPHPPGYPIWTMLSWLFTRVFAFVTFRGQPNPAWSVGLMSAVFGALAAGITAMLICRSGSEMLRESLHRLHETGRRTADLICWAAGVSCSLLFAFSPVMWSQSTIVEVYSLNAFFLVWIFLLTYQWMLRSSDRLLIVMAFIFGLGLTNYQVLLLAALPLAFAVFLRDIRLFRDFLILGLPYLLVIGGIKQGVLPAISHPTDATGITYMLLNVAAIGLAWWLLPRGRTVALTFLMAELGLAFYAYMPIVSDLRNPPMNWGYPRTWEGFRFRAPDRRLPERPARPVHAARGPARVPALHGVGDPRRPPAAAGHVCRHRAGCRRHAGRRAGARRRSRHGPGPPRRTAGQGPDCRHPVPDVLRGRRPLCRPA